MRLVHIHTTDPALPTTIGTPHRGYWAHPLKGGSYIVMIGTHHATTTRMHVAAHAVAGTTVLPAVSSTTNLPPAVCAILAAHLGMPLATTFTVYSALAALFAACPWEPMLDPDSV